MNKKLIEWLLSEDTGLSSEHLVGHMSGIPVREYAPCDEWDRGRCVRLLKLFPEWIERLDEMKKYREWTEQIPLIREALQAKGEGR